MRTLFPLLKRYKTFKHDWELTILEGGDQTDSDYRTDFGSMTELLQLNLL